MEKLPKKCLVCGFEPMVFQLLQSDFDDEVSVIGSGCLKCQKCWVETKENLKKHPHEENIFEV